MVVAKLTYEDVRKQRLEENKKRMEELHLPLLAQALKNSSSPKPSPRKQSGPRSARKEIVEVRRSGRIANNPAPEYREIITYERERFSSPRKYGSGSYRRKDLDSRVYASDKDRANATLKAEEVEVELGSEYPTFVKPMLQSHVTGGFWLGLPSYFCRRHLPTKDATFTLIDEDGEEFPTVYLAGKTGLSGGWRGFSIEHRLVDGDALVFQLVRSTAFKVFITRVNDPSKEEDDDETQIKEAFYNR